MRIWISCIVLAFLALPSFAGGRQERPPPCLKPAQNATVYGWTHACDGKEGNAALVGEYRCLSADGSWVTIHYWRCEEFKPVREK